MFLETAEDLDAGAFSAAFFSSDYGQARKQAIGRVRDQNPRLEEMMLLVVIGSVVLLVGA